jgi:hypothetical protein
MEIKKKRRKRDHSKAKTIEVQRYAAKVFKKRQDELERRRMRHPEN